MILGIYELLWFWQNISYSGFSNTFPQKQDTDNCTTLKLSFSDVCTYREELRCTALTFPCSPSALCWCRRWQHHSSLSHKDPASDSDRDKKFIREHFSLWVEQKHCEVQTVLYKPSDYLTISTLCLHLRVKSRKSHSDVLKCPPDSNEHWPEPAPGVSLTQVEELWS